MASIVLQQLDRFGPERCETLTFQEASDYSHTLAKTHYENFSVVSCLLPKALRQDFGHVYAFCRWADDLGDETGDPQRSLELLQWWKEELTLCYQNKPRHPVYVALASTIEKHDIPAKPFEDLIDAFIQDQTVTRYDTWEQVLDYCTRSADPVGRLVLYMLGYRDEERQKLSDATCTALQLANFWQDVRRDVLERDRVYIPNDVARKHNLDIDTMVRVIRASAKPGETLDGSGSSSTSCGACPPSAGVHAIMPAYRATVKELVDRTWPLFEQGQSLWPLIRRPERDNIKLFSWGGQSILRMIEKADYDTMQTRPKLSKAGKMWLIARCLVGRLMPGGGA